MPLFLLVLLLVALVKARTPPPTNAHEREIISALYLHVSSLVSVVDRGVGTPTYINTAEADTTALLAAATIDSVSKV